MGASSSAPRALSVENPEPAPPPQAGGGAAVQVSEAALRRAVASASRQHPQEAPTTQAQPNQAYAPPPAPLAPPTYDHRPKYDYAKEEEYWSRRIEGLKRTHQSLNKKMEEEYNKAVSETTQMFERTHKSSIVGKMPPCQQEKSIVLKCYEDNPTQTLLCTQLVNAFNNCVAQKRCESAATGA